MGNRGDYIPGGFNVEIRLLLACKKIQTDVVRVHII